MHLRVAPSPITKKGADLYQSTAYTFNGLRFDEYGAYRFQLSLDDHLLTSVPLSVIPPAVSSVIPGSFDLPQENSDDHQKDIRSRPPIHPHRPTHDFWLS